MDAIYASMPIDTHGGELRLITILPESPTSKLVRCKIQRACLEDTTEEYNEFLANWRPRSRSSYAKTELEAWCASQQLPTAMTGPHRMLKFPEDPRAFRYVWGDYAALSYAWGDPDVTQTIEVNGREVKVTANLAEALGALRTAGHFSGAFQLWVDALCINQADVEERALQVASMRRFYSTAWSVVGYTGPEAEDSDMAIDLVDDLASYYGRPEECERLRDVLMESHGDHPPGSWLALNRLTLRPYWERLWIMQEICLGAMQTVIFAGVKRIDWYRFGCGIEVVHRYLWLAKDKCVDRDRKAIDPDDNRTWELSGPLHHIWKDLWALSQQERLENEPLTFSRLLEVATFANSYDPRDKVYGLLGMMPIELAAEIVPDYEIDAVTVFSRMAMSYISVYRNLEFLRDSNVWGPTSAPTWVPDWAWRGRIRDSRPGAESDLQIKYGSGGAGEEANRPYNADRGLPFRGVERDGSRLLCQAVIFDQVDGVGSHPPAGPDTVVQPTRWPQRTSPAQQSAYGDAEATAIALSRALCADRSHAAPTSRALFHLPTTMAAAERAFRRANWTRFEQDLVYYNRWTDWVHSNAGLIVGGRPLIDYLDGRDKDSETSIPTDASFIDYWADYQAWMRTTLGRLLATTAAGRIAWVPYARGGAADDRTRPGDLLAVFPGCTTPIVLRAAEEDCFQVVGEAYVHGVMEGELADMVKQGRYHIQEIQLC